MGGNELRVNIWRGGPGGGEMMAYRAPRWPSQTALDVVTWIQRHVEPGLSYRFSCRVGMCGSCAMTVNGVPRWTCRTHVKDVARRGIGIGRGERRPHLELAPLRNLPVLKDLVCDMSEFFRKWQRAEGVFHGDRGEHGGYIFRGGRGDGRRDNGHHGDNNHRGRHGKNDTRDTTPAPILPADPRRIAADAAIECINCAVCYAACDVVASNPNYLGPAALNRAWTLLNDARDAAQYERVRAIADVGGGCQNCHSQHNCARHCPVQLSPARSIAGLKQRAVRAAWRGQLL